MNVLIVVPVHDDKMAEEFYCRTLGLFRREPNGSFSLRHDPFFIIHPRLLKDDVPTGEQIDIHDEKHQFLFSLTVDDCVQVYKRLMAAGVTLEPPSGPPYGRYISFFDPFGNRIQVGDNIWESSCYKDCGRYRGRKPEWFFRLGKPMTEAEWLISSDPKRMLDFLSEKASGRKLRLFACACCRRIWDSFVDMRSRHCIDTVERFVDGFVSEAAFNAASDEAVYACDKLQGSAEPQYVIAASSAAEYASHAWAHSAYAAACTVSLRLKRDPDREKLDPAESAAQCDLVRDIIGNPFRCETIDPSCLTDSVRSVAQSIYDDRWFERMLELADSLEAAGCKNGTVLEHCRGPRAHARGCWVLDLILGKE